MSKTELPMTKRHPRSQPTWTDVKAKLASLDRIALTSLIQDLYAAHKDNRTFLQGQTSHFQLPKGGWRTCRARRADGVLLRKCCWLLQRCRLPDEGHFNALVHMFEQALKVIRQLPAADRDALIDRLERVRAISHNLGYGVGDDMDSLLVNYTGA